MARRPKIDIERDALELLALTMQGTKQRFRDAKAEGYSVDAATISATVSLLKLVEAFRAAKGDEAAVELDALRAEFQAKRTAAKQPSRSTAQQDPAEVFALYGLADPTESTN
ncbi:hypothetical protein [Stutzerimonas nitrititolerans]|uniref:hypothetical protein n=1 Tax=Stutzerimonas nitrititolerans TaxID=2482751 RepID=UPI0028A90E6F|nr:hypothetical protein [Stutzerimonas nitrititolerans]